jgi:hypothetical protein
MLADVERNVSFVGNYWLDTVDFLRKEMNPALQVLGAIMNRTYRSGSLTAKEIPYNPHSA